ncbi:hypothetical protein N0B44_26065 [Roseibacterium beibuensis]|uniref:hypothetical protein n=1 Tax=[Roseibacterium] beibuensis TaxID=1193142 RepID=UPI00217ED839|nr:hypothetical protein [Roseibacterium beibuensis]MCS6626392.1 hypothetical protein [Roseibacterium beibuensis]
MSGMLIAMFAGLMTPQAAPHPSTLEPYSAPAIRPFEPGSDFGRELAEGDAAGAAHRRPLEAPVTVDAYRGSYEVTPTDLEIAYEQGVTSAELRADQSAGPLDGPWRIRDAGGRTLYDVVLMDPGVGTAEGGWRNGRGAGAAVSDGRTLTLEDGGGTIALERAANGWRGRLTVDGRSRPVTITRPH